MPTSARPTSQMKPVAGMSRQPPTVFPPESLETFSSNSGIGQVAETRQPVNLDRVPPEVEQSPCCRQVPNFLDTGRKAQVQGVLFVRQRQQRRLMMTKPSGAPGRSVGAPAMPRPRRLVQPVPPGSSSALIEWLLAHPLAIGQGIAVFDNGYRRHP